MSDDNDIALPPVIDPDAAGEIDFVINPDGSVTIPEVLRPYVGKDRITPVSAAPAKA